MLTCQWNYPEECQSQCHIPLLDILFICLVFHDDNSFRDVVRCGATCGAMRCDVSRCGATCGARDVV